MKQSILDDANTTDKLGDIIRRRNNPWYLDTEWEQKFGGKPLGSPVSTLYPNLIAEIAITDRPMSNIPDYAKISKEVFGAVVEYKEELSAQELFSLARKLDGRFPALEHNMTLGYALSPVLATIDRNSRKAKVYYWQLTELQKRAEGCHMLWGFNEHLLRITLAVLDTAHPLSDGVSPVIPYAYFRYCMRKYEEAIAECEDNREFNRRLREETRRERKGKK